MAAHPSQAQAAIDLMDLSGASVAAGALKLLDLARDLDPTGITGTFVDIVTKIKETYNTMEQNKEDSRVILERVEGCVEIVAEQTKDAQRRALVLQHKYFQTALKNLKTCLDECPALLKTIATPASDCCAQSCFFLSASSHAEQISAYSQKLQEARDEFTKNMIPLMAEVLKELAAQSAKAAEEARQLALRIEEQRAADVVQAAALANQHASHASDSAAHIENKVDSLAEVISSALHLNISLNQKALQALRTFIDEAQHKQAHDKLEVRHEVAPLRAVMHAQRTR
jgi:hypothetical protein